MSVPFDNYGTPFGLSKRSPKPVVAQRDPTAQDVGFDPGTVWVNQVTNSEWISPNSGVWSAVGGGTAEVSTINHLPPTGGDIEIAGTAAQIGIANAGSTVTLSLIGPYTPATYTAHGVLIGEAAASIHATAAGTTGQVLIGATGADPAFGALGVNSGLTAHGVLLGEANSAIAATTAGSTGQVLIGSTGADPAFGALGVNSGLTGLVVGNNNSAFTTTTFTTAASFTPAFSLATPGDSAWTYTVQLGRYTQIGAIVYFMAQITWTNFANTTGSGNWQLNLPVTSGAFAMTGQVAISGSGVDASAETANLPANFLGVVGNAASVVVLSVEEGGVGNAANALFNLTVSQVKTAGTMNISGFYFAA